MTKQVTKKPSTTNQERSAQPHPSVPLGSITLPQEPSFAEGIENALSNPLTSVRLSVQSQGYFASRVDYDGWVGLINTLLSDIQVCLDVAWKVLGRVNNELSSSRMPDAGFSERVRARVLLAELADWLVTTNLLRSCTPPELPAHRIELTDEVLGRFNELARLGRVLRMVWLEVNGGVATLRTGLAEAEARLHAAQPIDKTNHLFLSARKAAELSSIGVDVLKTRRHSGDKSPNGAFGIDRHGLIWAKPGKQAHVLYLKSSLPLKPFK